MWSHQQSFWLYSNDARRRVHRRPNERFHPECVHGEVQAGCGSGVFCECFSYYQLLLLTAAITNMKQHVNFNTLDNQVLPLGQHLYVALAVDISIFQDDNSKDH